MLHPTETTLRRLALVVFACEVACVVGYVVMSRGLEGRPGLTYAYQFAVGTALGILVAGSIGLAVTWARPRNPVGWLMALTALCLALSTAGQTYGARAVAVPEEGLPGAAWVLSLSAPLWVPGVFISVTTLLVRYPTGRVDGRWPRRFDRAALAGFVLMYLGYAGNRASVTDVAQDLLPPVVLPGGDLVVSLGAALILGSATLIVGDSVRRARRAAGPERMALLWLLVTAVLAVVTIMFGPYEWTGDLVYCLVMAAVGLGVVRYRALGIDLVVRRALTYAVLTGTVLLVLVAVVAALTQVASNEPVQQAVAALVIALVLAPARDRIQGFVDRLIYGDRDDPFAALHRLAGPVRGGEGRDILAEVLQGLAEALLVDGAAVRGAGGVVVGELPEQPLEVPLVFGGEQLGHLAVGNRSGQRSLSGADRRLVDAVAPLIAAVLHAVRLAEDLRLEKERVLGATQVERSRLRAELHDGLGPSLTGLGLGLEALAPAVEGRKHADLVRRLREEVAASLEETRRIIDDLQPSALDTVDLATALRRRAEQVGAASGLQVTLTAPGELHAVTAPVAGAVYRIVDEALTNVVRHARAASCRVVLRIDDRLRIEVIDDGVGPGPLRDGGVGLASMRERAERLGGSFVFSAVEPGSAVIADFPLEVRA